MQHCGYWVIIERTGNMQIQNNMLIAECSAYDFKEMLERKKSEVVA